jgi:aminomethyltransferase
MPPFMTDAPVAALLKTPLHRCHLALGARMVSFGGWDMPLQYSGITEEHLAVRRSAGLFDVSHMGEIEVAGSDALAAVQQISTNDAARLAIGQAQYSALTTPEGTFVDDLLVYRLADEHFLLVVNASSIRKDFAWITERIQDYGDAVAVNTSSRYALIAVQGPRALDIVQPLTDVDLTSIGYYWFAHGEVANVRSTISRTGYTGEDGLEIFVAPPVAERLWTALLSAGEPAGLLPAGLGARDTLRLEAAMRLSGQDIDDTTSVLEAGLGWIVGWEKSDFVGRDALVRQRHEGVMRKLVGFEMVERGIARHGYQVFIGGELAGVVTSGTRTPFLEKAVGLAYLPSGKGEPGTECAIEIRGRRVRARVVPLPFYKRPRG